MEILKISESKIKNFINYFLRIVYVFIEMLWEREKNCFQIAVKMFVFGT